MDKLELLNKIIAAHQVIRGSLSSVGVAVADREAMFSLEKEQSHWTPGQPGDLAQKHAKCEEAMGQLGQALKEHFAMEERHLPSLFGDLLMRGLLLEHRDLIEGLERARAMVAASNPEGLSREQSLERQSNIRVVIENLSRRVEDHASQEEIIFDMLKRALEENPSG